MSQTKAELIDAKGDANFDSGTLYVDATNNRVGIGTSSPAALLEASSATGSATPTPTEIRLSSTTNAADWSTTDPWARVGFYSADTTGGARLRGAIDTIQTFSNGNVSSLAFKLDDASTGLVERMRITYDGKVGVGTTSPSTRLAVVESGVSTAAEILIAGTNTNGDASCQARIGAVQDGALTSGALTFSTRLSGTTSERARIDSSGKLLVGTSTSYNVGSTGSALLQSVVTSTIPTGSFTRYTNDNDGAIISLGKSRGTSAGSFTVVQSGDIIGNIRFAGADGGDLETQAASIRCEVDGTPGANDMPGRLVFSTTADGASSPTEQMRITNGGIIAIGNTAATNLNTIQSGTPTSFWISTTGTTSDPPAEFYGNSTGNRFHICFSNSNGVVGSIRTNATATAYLTSSDYRLKENVVAVTDGITRLQQLKPSRFNFIVDPDVTVDGFLAHEAQTVVPECVSGTKDEVDEDGNPIYQGIDQSKLVPLLTAALQEAIGRIETLEAEVAALKAQ